MEFSVIWNNLPLLLALVGGFVALVKKSYGYERDIRHLQRDLPQLSANTAQELEDLEKRIDQLERRLDINGAKGEVVEQVLSLLERSLIKG